MRGEATETATVGLSEAAAVAGVSLSTIRRWADEGQIPSFRTPGGHRRFHIADLQRALAPATSTTAAVEVFGARGATRLRRQLTTGRARDLDWLVGLDEAARDRLRLLGRHLMATIDDYLAHRRPRAPVLAEARQFGLMYGRELAAARFTVRQAIEAFTFVRRSLEETARRYAAGQRRAPAEMDDLRDQLDALNDRVLLGIAEAYDRLPGAGPAGEAEPK